MNFRKSFYFINYNSFKKLSRQKFTSPTTEKLILMALQLIKIVANFNKQRTVAPSQEEIFGYFVSQCRKTSWVTHDLLFAMRESIPGVELLLLYSDWLLKLVTKSELPMISQNGKKSLKESIVLQNPTKNYS